MSQIISDLACLISCSKYKGKHQWQGFAAILLLFSFFIKPVAAADWEVQLHQGTSIDTQGIALSVSDSFSRKQPLYWHLSYTKLDEYVHQWNNADQLVPISTLDATLGYRYSHNRFNSRAKGLSVEFQLGAAFSLLDTEFTFNSEADLPDTKLSEIGDIAPVAVLNLSYNLTRFSKITLGVKHLNNFAELGNVTTAYVGFSYQIGNRRYGL